jgi:hypothetical protein
MRVLVERSRVRPAVATAVGIIALVAALDIAVLGWVYPEAETNAETGEYTFDGKAERRGDVGWGIFGGLGGGAMVAWGVRGLTHNRRLLAADDERIVVAIGPPGHEMWSVGWNEVFAIKSAVDNDATGRVSVLDIELAGDALAPTDPRGARVVGDHVLIDAEDWKPPLDQVVGLLQVLLDRARA